MRNAISALVHNPTGADFGENDEANTEIHHSIAKSLILMHINNSRSYTHLSGYKTFLSYFITPLVVHNIKLYIRHALPATMSLAILQNSHEVPLLQSSLSSYGTFELNFATWPLVITCKSRTHVECYSESVTHEFSCLLLTATKF